MSIDPLHQISLPPENFFLAELEQHLKKSIVLPSQCNDVNDCCDNDNKLWYLIHVADLLQEGVMIMTMTDFEYSAMPMM